MISGEKLTVRQILASVALCPGLATLHYRRFQNALVALHALFVALQIDRGYCGQALQLHVASPEVLVRDAEFQTESRGLQAIPFVDNIGPYQVVGVNLKACCVFTIRMKTIFKSVVTFRTQKQICDGNITSDN